MKVTNYPQLLSLVGTSEYDQIVEINIADQNIESLPDSLPVGLRRLSCSGNRLTKLPALPSGLQELSCDHNYLTSLSALPVGLRKLNCHNNQLTILPSLPDSLLELYCGNNQLTRLSIPIGLNELYCHRNKLPFSDISTWKAITLIHKLLYSPVITKFQRRWRQRRLFRAIKEELLAAIYHPNNPCGPAKQAEQSWIETRLWI